MAFPEVIHRDEDLLVVHKPSGVPTTSPSSSDFSLVRWIADRFPALNAHPTSRLDSPVSGLVTFALNKAANQRLLEARTTDRYERLYLGIAVGAVDIEPSPWTWPISINPKNPKLRVAGPGRGQRDGRTRYEVAVRTKLAKLLHLFPETGRTHQLRVHAARAGAPLFGDHAYGGERRVTLSDGRVVTARRVMLHCARVSFPWGSEVRRFEADPPADMENVWVALGGTLNRS